MEVSIVMGVLPNGFITENSIKMDDSGVPPFQEPSICVTVSTKTKTMRVPSDGRPLTNILYAEFTAGFLHRNSVLAVEHMHHTD